MSGPHKDEGPGDTSAEAPNNFSNHAASVSTDSGDGKRFASLRAELALRGYCLSALSDGSYLIHRWNLTRSVADLRDAAMFLRQIGGAE